MKILTCLCVLVLTLTGCGEGMKMDKKVAHQSTAALR